MALSWSCCLPAVSASDRTVMALGSGPQAGRVPSMPTYIDLHRAAALLPSVRRISVAGVSGAGKSTLAQALAARYGLRYVSLDRDMRWLPGWRMRDRAGQKRLHDGFVAEDRWVIDGTSIGLMDTRLPRSELLIWMRPPRASALAGVARRVATQYGRVRSDMAPGCPEKLPDLEFLRWIWQFERRQAPRLVAAVDRIAPDLPVLVLRTRRDGARLFGDGAG